MNKDKNQAEELVENTMAEANDAVAALEVKITELTEDLQRTRADFENFRKQTDLQRGQLMKITEYATIEKVLPVLDTVELAIQHNESLAPLAKTFEKSLNDLGLKMIDANTGTPFDPDFHEAARMEEGDGGDTEVVSEVLRPGYLYNGEVLRPAMVVVKKQ